MEITQTAISQLINYANNAKIHNDKQVDMLAASIKEFGFNNPILIDDKNTIIAGHGRLMAAKKLNLDKVPTIKLSHLSDAQRKAYILADNRLAEVETSWDMELVSLELKNLQELDFDIDLTGFEIGDIGGVDEAGLTDEDAVPEPPEEPISKMGDVWILGNHRVMCGDSTSSDDVDKLMNGEKADMVFTSPPYNANTKSGQGDIFNRKKSVKLYSDGYSDNLNSSDYVDFSKSVLNNCFLFTDGFIFWNVSYNANSRFEYIEQIQKHLQFLIEQICWKKSSTIPFKGSLMRDWEPIYVFSTNGNMLGLDSVNSNYWEVNNTNSQQDNHKACFPIELPFKAINLKKQFKLILEPFLGSGTTLIAAEKLKRKCYGMELDEKYCDVIIERWEQFTGEKAIKNGTK